MAICKPLQSIMADFCLNNKGGLKQEVLVFPSISRSETDFVISSGDTVVETIKYTDDATSSGATVAPAKLTFHKNTATFSEDLAQDAASANQTNTITLTITLNNRAYAKSAALSVFAAGGRELDVYFSQRNGTNWMIPNATLAINSTVGATRQEGSSYVLTFTCEEDQLVYGVEDADYLLLAENGSF